MCKPEKQPSAKSLGEHAIIELMRSRFEAMPDVVVPFGDDVSALPFGEGDVAVLKADMLVGKTDVPAGMSFWQAARKAVVMNVSDFASKGAVPRAVMVSLGLPPNLTQSDLVALADGLNAGAREYGCYVVGGDTAETSGLIVSVQVYGASKKDGLMLRGGAVVGDVLAVTGLFGKSVAGLQLLLNGSLRVPERSCGALVDAVLMPQARLREGLALRASGAVSACMDSSDGLVWCLNELGVQSGVGFVVSNLPVAKEAQEFAELNMLDAAELALYGGEEYELVLTVKPDLWAAAEAAVAGVGGKLLPIGKATAGKRVLLDLNGKQRVIHARGYEHFKT
ncbi:MAG: thiamine-phosphate kinase [Candidatus Bathyarchaeota archaeon]|nr:thiamine-phosphate kinase [Candidatus Bathyarchaeota archaeon]